MTREYTFVVGPETPTQPTAGTPSADTDFLTLGFANSTYCKGGYGFTWNPKAGSAPLEDFENGEKIYEFQNNVTQFLVAFIKVPEGYVAGTQIKLYIGYYTSSTTNNVFLVTDTYLIRESTDAVTSTTNKHDSTNTEDTNGSPGSRYNKVELDLTDADGEINSVAVSAGDMLRVELTRDWGNESTPDTNDTKVIPSSSEIVM